MKSKLILVVMSICMLMELVVVPVFAEEKVNTGILEWDFSSYTEEIVGNAGSVTSAGGIVEYNGLKIYLANNAGDKINTDGVTWNGGSTDFNRGISYIPEAKGTLIVTGTIKNSKKLGISTVTTGDSFLSRITSSNKSSFSALCDAGQTYYIRPLDVSGTVNNIKFVPYDVSVLGGTKESGIYTWNVLQEVPNTAKGGIYSASGEYADLTVSLGSTDGIPAENGLIYYSGTAVADPNTNNTHS